MQARPHLDLRVLGILSLLADEFGETSSEGRVINIHLTHAQLASATGSTRATITRTISDLKKLGKLSSLSTSAGERYCLLSWDSCSHLALHPAK
jgi:CRP-like cAMP-binding protein